MKDWEEITARWTTMTNEEIRNDCHAFIHVTNFVISVVRELQQEREEELAREKDQLKSFDAKKTAGEFVSEYEYRHCLGRIEFYGESIARMNAEIAAYEADIARCEAKIAKLNMAA